LVHFRNPRTEHGPQKCGGSGIAAHASYCQSGATVTSTVEDGGPDAPDDNNGGTRRGRRPAFLCRFSIVSTLSKGAAAHGAAGELNLPQSVLGRGQSVSWRVTS